MEFSYKKKRVNCCLPFLNIYLLIGLQVLIASCEGDKYSIQEVSSEDYRVYTASNPAQPVLMSEYFGSFSETKLSFPEGEFLGRPGGVFSYVDGFGIWDTTDQSILIFDDSGNMIRKIKSYGPGPEEYEKVTAVVWNKYSNMIDVLDGPKRRLLSFSLLGDLIGVKVLEKGYHPVDFEPMSSGYVFQLIPSLENGEILVTNEKLKKRREFFQDDKYVFLPSPSQMLSTDEYGDLFFHLAFREEIYSLAAQSGEVSKSMKVDFGEYQIPSGYFGELDKTKGNEIMKRLNELMQQKTAVNFLPIFKGRDVLFQTVLMGGKEFYVFLNTKNKRSIIKDVLVNDINTFRFQGAKYGSQGLIYNLINNDEERFVLQTLSLK